MQLSFNVNAQKMFEGQVCFFERNHIFFNMLINSSYHAL